MKHLWTRLGHYPGANLAAYLVSILIVVHLIWSLSAALIVWGALAICFAVYCVARPRGGIDAWMAFACPAGSAWIFHLLTGLPYPGLAALLLAIGLLALINIDREDGLAPVS
jgi:hypothetical protein